MKFINAIIDYAIKDVRRSNIELILYGAAMINIGGGYYMSALIWFVVGAFIGGIIETKGGKTK